MLVLSLCKMQIIVMANADLKFLSFITFLRVHSGRPVGVVMRCFFRATVYVSPQVKMF